MASSTSCLGVVVMFQPEILGLRLTLPLLESSFPIFVDLPPLLLLDPSIPRWNVRWRFRTTMIKRLLGCVMWISTLMTMALTMRERFKFCTRLFILEQPTSHPFPYSFTCTARLFSSYIWPSRSGYALGPVRCGSWRLREVPRANWSTTYRPARLILTITFTAGLTLN